MDFPSYFQFVSCTESEFNRMLNYNPRVNWASGRPCALYDDCLGFPIAFYLEDYDSLEHELHFYKRIGL